MSHYLPPSVYAFFEQSTEVKFRATKHKLPKRRPFDPVAPLLPHLPTLPEPVPSEHEKAQLEKVEKEEAHAEVIALGRQEYDQTRDDEPLEQDAQLTSDPKLTIFIGRLDYRVDKIILEKEFARFGTIVSCRVVNDPLFEAPPSLDDDITGSDDVSIAGIRKKSLGYAFIQFSTIEECQRAYKEADGLKLLGKNIVVDFERRRVDSTWYPRRLGGGEGTTRHSNKALIVTAPGRYLDHILKLQRIEEEKKQFQNQQRNRGFNERNRDRFGHNSRGHGGGGHGGGGHGGGGHGGGGHGGFGGQRNSGGFGNNNFNRGGGGGSGFQANHGRDRDRNYHHPR
jgi:U1 small nuclear ribonucleoprotein